MRKLNKKEQSQLFKLGCKHFEIGFGMWNKNEKYFYRISKYSNKKNVEYCVDEIFYDECVRGWEVVDEWFYTDIEILLKSFPKIVNGTYYEENYN